MKGRISRFRQARKYAYIKKYRSFRRIFDQWNKGNINYIRGKQRKDYLYVERFVNRVVHWQTDTIACLLESTLPTFIYIQDLPETYTRHENREGETDTTLLHTINL